MFYFCEYVGYYGWFVCSIAGVEDSVKDFCSKYKVWVEWIFGSFICGCGDIFFTFTITIRA